MSGTSLRRTAGGALAAGLMLAGLQAAVAQQAKVDAAAADDYTRYCVACHGSAGKGEGELASKLVKPPSDLTQITARYGELPYRADLRHHRQ